MKIRRDVTLRDGTAAQLRTLEAGDAEAVLELLKATSRETRNMMRGAQEWNETREREAQIIHAAQMSAREMMLGAFVDGRLAGLIQNRVVSGAARTQHRTGVGLAVRRAYWRRGIGAALLGEMIDALRATNLEQIELKVVSTNEAAVALYEKFGFERYGCLTRAMKYSDGTYADMLLMKLDLAGKP